MDLRAGGVHVRLGTPGSGNLTLADVAAEWWTLAGPEGNELDIAVSIGREELWPAIQAEAN